MIKKFLSLSVERKALIVLWLYDRYVVGPALDELQEMGMQVEFEPEFVVFEEKPVIH